MHEDAPARETIFEVCEAQAIETRLPQVWKEYFDGSPALVITDSVIWAVVSARFGGFLDSGVDAQIHVLPGIPAPYASHELVESIAALIRSTGRTAIAVGAGTINDVVKRASFECGKSYLCIPTAPSVDGFASYGAAITMNGFKTTMECPAPRCILADSQVLAEAPYELIAAGFGDLAAKLTGGVDWIIADALGIEKIDRISWDLVQPLAATMIGKAHETRMRDTEAIRTLYSGLTACGFAMQRYRDSRPASGMEHIMSHTWEMEEVRSGGAHVSHGFKVAVGTLIATALAEILYGTKGDGSWIMPDSEFTREGSCDAGQLLARRLASVKTLLGDSPFRPKAMEIVRQKTPGQEELDRRRALFIASRKAVAGRIAGQLPSFAAMRNSLEEAGCPVEPAQIGLSRPRCLQSFLAAALVRTRYTMLDLADESGLLEKSAEMIFSAPYFNEYAR
jgi:glycerol-1-phosphate dehydrogenase [NAD(P)+]